MRVTIKNLELNEKRPFLTQPIVLKHFRISLYDQKRWVLVHLTILSYVQNLGVGEGNKEEI